MDSAEICRAAAASISPPDFDPLVDNAFDAVINRLLQTKATSLSRDALELLLVGVESRVREDAEDLLSGTGNIDEAIHEIIYALTDSAIEKAYK